MAQKREKQAAFAKVRRAADAGAPALTILRAKQFLIDHPNYGPAWTALAVALIETAQYSEARLALARAIDSAPPDKLWIPFMQMGELFKFQGDYVEAEVWYRKVIVAAPFEATGHILLGGVLARQGRLTEAEESHRRAIVCNKGCIDEAFLNLGLVLRAQGRYEEASDCFRQAIAIDADYIPARVALRDVEACLRHIARARP